MEISNITDLLKKYSVLKTELKDQVNQNVVGLKSILEKKKDSHKKRIAEKNQFFIEVPKTIISDNDSEVNLTMDDLINMIFVTNAEKRKFKKLKNAKENEVRRDIYNLAKREYFNQNTRVRHNKGSYIKDYVHTKIMTRFINDEWSVVNNSIDEDKIIFLNYIQQFERIRHSFSQFVIFINNKLENIRDYMNIQKTNTKLHIDELEMYEHDYEKIENEILNLMKDIMIPEGCYMILMSLSPPEWKEKFKIDKLNYVLVKSDSDLTKMNKPGCINPAYQKPLEEFFNDIQAEPILEMYWESEEQFTKYLTKLDMKTKDNMLVFDMMTNSKTKQNITKNKKWITKSQMSQLLFPTIQTKYEHIKDIVSNNTMCNIKEISINIYKIFDKRYDLDLIQPNNAVELLCDSLYKAFEQSDKIPIKDWKNTQNILNLIKNTKENERKIIKHKFDTIKTIRHEADKIYYLPPSNIRIQKRLPRRSQIPKQNLPSKTLKKPTLQNDQIMYLKCYTYLSNEDITYDNISIIPKLSL